MRFSWYVEADGKESGPYSSGELKHLVQSGRLQPSDLVRREDRSTATCASRVSGLFSSKSMPNAQVVGEQTPPIASTAVGQRIPPPLPRADSLEAVNRQSGIEQLATVAERTQAMALLATRIAERSKLVQIDLPRACQAIGRKSYETGEDRDEFQELFNRVDSLLQGRDAVDQLASGRKPQDGFAGRVRAAANGAIDFAQSKSFEFGLSKAYAELGEAIFGRLGVNPGRVDDFDSVRQLHARLNELNSEIDRLSQESQRHWISWKHVAVVTVLVLTFAILIRIISIAAVLGAVVILVGLAFGAYLLVMRWVPKRSIKDVRSDSGLNVNRPILDEQVTHISTSSSGSDSASVTPVVCVAMKPKRQSKRKAELLVQALAGAVTIALFGVVLHVAGQRSESEPRPSSSTEATATDIASTQMIHPEAAAVQHDAFVADETSDRTEEFLSGYPATANSADFVGATLTFSGKMVSLTGAPNDGRRMHLKTQFGGIDAVCLFEKDQAGRIKTKHGSHYQVSGSFNGLRDTGFVELVNCRLVKSGEDQLAAEVRPSVDQFVAMLKQSGSAISRKGLPIRVQDKIRFLQLVGKPTTKLSSVRDFHGTHDLLRFVCQDGTVIVAVTHDAAGTWIKDVQALKN